MMRKKQIHLSQATWNKRKWPRQSSTEDPITFDPRSPETVPIEDEESPLLLKDQQLLMQYHETLGHVSWDQLKVLASQGIIQRRLAKCPAPKCPGCIYGNANQKPWRTKAQPGKIKRATRPGETMSVDQMISTTVGLIPQAKGALTTRCYTGAAVFVDHASISHMFTSWSPFQEKKPSRQRWHLNSLQLHMESRFATTTVIMGDLLKSHLQKPAS